MSSEKIPFKQRLSGELLRLLPKNHLSYLVGNLVHKALPAPLAQTSVAWFAKRYKINLAEAEKPISEYKTIGQLFTRNLKAGIRPIHEGVVHPVDGRITSWGEIKSNSLLQAKGKTYSVSDFLRSADWAKKFEGGLFFTYYLCPTDYHQIHSPVDGEVVQATYVPGNLWPVNEWSVDSIDKLFSVNERLISFLKTDRGDVALVMVGATNVGKMSVSYDSELVTNQLNIHEPLVKKYLPAKKIAKGDKLGVFHMGSTVVMLYPRDYLNLSKADPTGMVRLGQTLGH